MNIDNNKWNITRHVFRLKKCKHLKEAYGLHTIEISPNI